MIRPVPSQGKLASSGPPLSRRRLLTLGATAAVGTSAPTLASMRPFQSSQEAGRREPAYSPRTIELLESLLVMDMLGVLLVLDEPTAGLDPNQIRQVRSLIGRLAQNKTVLLSTHILPEVEAICDRVLIIHRGKMVSEGDPESLRAGAVAREVVKIEGSGAKGEFEQALAGVPGVSVKSLKAVSGGLVKAQLETEGGPETAERIFRAVADAGLALRELRRQQASLEDVFANLTTDEAPAKDEEE